MPVPVGFPRFVRFNSRLREEATARLVRTPPQPHQVSTHSSVRRRQAAQALQQVSEQFQLTPP